MPVVKQMSHELMVHRPKFPFPFHPFYSLPMYKTLIKDELEEILKVSSISIIVYMLTNNIEGYEVAHLRFSRDLAFVVAGVSGLDILHLEGPSVLGVEEERLEPFVSDEGISVHR